MCKKKKKLDVCAQQLKIVKTTFWNGKQMDSKGSCHSIQQLEKCDLSPTGIGGGDSQKERVQNSKWRCRVEWAQGGFPQCLTIMNKIRNAGFHKVPQGMHIVSSLLHPSTTYPLLIISRYLTPTFQALYIYYPQSPNNSASRIAVSLYSLRN